MPRKPSKAHTSGHAKTTRRAHRADAENGDGASGRAIGAGTLSFGLVTIPIEIRTATHSESFAFHLLHETCGTRIKQQFYCPHCERVVERGDLVKGFETAPGRYATFTNEELKALDAEANRAIEIQEFVPLASVDPIYFEQAHYLSPDDGAEKSYWLLAHAMRDADRVAIAQHTSRGKDHIVMVRAREDGLVMHTLFDANEVRTPARAGAGRAKAGEKEAALARQLIEQLSADAFHPDRYHDAYRERVQAAIARKAAGHELVAAEAERPAARVTDLMQALKESLSRSGGATRETGARAATAPRTGRGGSRRATAGRARSKTRRG